MDADGHGVSTYGDRYAFNYWLGLGGDLTTALESAELGGDVIDLSSFFKSSAAVLGESASDPVVGVAEDETQDSGGGQAGLESGGSCSFQPSAVCPTAATIVPPFGAPHSPGSVFCGGPFRNPTGADLDDEGGFWYARSVPGDIVSSGVGFLDLSNVPPASKDGSIPLGSPKTSDNDGYRAAAIVVRKEQLGNEARCPYKTEAANYNAITPWPALVGEVGSNRLCVHVPAFS